MRFLAVSASNGAAARRKWSEESLDVGVYPSCPVDAHVRHLGTEPLQKATGFECARVLDLAGDDVVRTVAAAEGRLDNSRDSVSGIRMATTTPDTNVSPPIPAIAHLIPNRSAIAPASKAPTAYPKSRHNR